VTELDSGANYAKFTGAPLAQDLEVVGLPQLHLFVSATAPTRITSCKFWSDCKWLRAIGHAWRFQGFDCGVFDTARY